MNTKAIYFDMDGTIADLYAVEDWLPKLRAGNPSPYQQAKPLLKMQPLARKLNELQKKGYVIGIISWLSKGSTEEYAQAVTSAKITWLKKHLGSVEFDELRFEPHGKPKADCVSNPFGILFDDEQKNQDEWRGKAYSPEHIMNILKALA